MKDLTNRHLSIMADNREVREQLRDTIRQCKISKLLVREQFAKTHEYIAEAREFAEAARKFLTSPPASEQPSPSASQD